MEFIDREVRAPGSPALGRPKQRDPVSRRRDRDGRPRTDRRATVRSTLAKEDLGIDGRTTEPLHFEFTSHLESSAATVWSCASTMSGVNDELRPLMRMTTPRTLGGTRDNIRLDAPIEFASWLLALRLLPFDRHRLRIERVIANDDGARSEHGFDERSSSLLQREWVHHRRITPEPLRSGCTVSDHLEITPRLRLTRPIVSLLVRRLFEHRHRRLRTRHGGTDSSPAAVDA